MSLLVDDARWSWRGARWCHLASDCSLDELHEFAARLGVRRMAFHGDHYDLPADRRPDALAAGACAVPSRELLARMRAAGLRLAPADRPGRWLPVLGGEVPDALRAAAWGVAAGGGEPAWFARPRTWVAVVELGPGARPAVWPTPEAVAHVQVTPLADRTVVELFATR